MIHTASISISFPSIFKRHIPDLRVTPILLPSESDTTTQKVAKIALQIFTAAIPLLVAFTVDLIRITYQSIREKIYLDHLAKEESFPCLNHLFPLRESGFPTTFPVRFQPYPPEEFIKQQKYVDFFTTLRKEIEKRLDTKNSLKPPQLNTLPDSFKELLERIFFFEFALDLRENYHTMIQLLRTNISEETSPLYQPIINYIAYSLFIKVELTNLAYKLRRECHPSFENTPAPTWEDLSFYLRRERGWFQRAIAQKPQVLGKSEAAKLLQKAQGASNFCHDASWYNISHKLFDLQQGEHRTTYFRTGAPTLSGLWGETKVTPEFLAFLTYIKRKEKKLLYINHMAASSRAEGARVDLLKPLFLKDPSAGYFFSLPLDHWMNDLTYPLWKQNPQQIKNQLMQGLSQDHMGFFFPKKELLPQIDMLLKQIFYHYLPQANPTPEQKRACIFLWYSAIKLQLQTYLKVDFVACSCKDSIDRGNISAHMDAALCLWLTSEETSPPELQTWVTSLMMPSWIVKKQPILMDRLELLCQTLDLFKQASLEAKDFLKRALVLGEEEISMQPFFPTHRLDTPPSIRGTKKEGWKELLQRTLPPLVHSLNEQPPFSLQEFRSSVYESFTKRGKNRTQALQEIHTQLEKDLPRMVFLWNGKRMKSVTEVQKNIRRLLPPDEPWDQTLALFQQGSFASPLISLVEAINKEAKKSFYQGASLQVLETKGPLDLSLGQTLLNYLHQKELLSFKKAIVTLIEAYQKAFLSVSGYPPIESICSHLDIVQEWKDLTYLPSKEEEEMLLSISKLSLEQVYILFRFLRSYQPLFPKEEILSIFQEDMLTPCEVIPTSIHVHTNLEKSETIFKKLVAIRIINQAEFSDEIAYIEFQTRLDWSQPDQCKTTYNLFF